MQPMAAMAPAPHGKPQHRGSWRLPALGMALRPRYSAELALTLALAVWMLWSVVVVRLPAAGFHFSTNQLFWLAALPALSAATLRLFSAFAAPLAGGGRYTAVAVTSLLLPALGLGYAVQDPRTSYEWMVALALLCGLGGALGSGLGSGMGSQGGADVARGHLGVAWAQLVVPLVIGAGVFSQPGGAPQPTTSGPMWLQNAGFVWVPLIAVAALLAWLRRGDVVNTEAGFARQAVIITRKPTWLMCWLVLGGLGSYIGWSAAVPLLVQHQFPQVDLLHFVWLGPLLGALLRPVGGWLADRHGAARIGLLSFVALALATAAVLHFLPGAGQGGSLPGLLAALAVLFAASGLAMGSTFRMIPALFLHERQHAADPLPMAQALATQQGRVEAAAVCGLAAAIGAYGGFFIPKGFGTAIALTGSPAAALQFLIAFYGSCIWLTWWHCGRRRAAMHC